MDDFGLLTKDFGLRPQGKSAPMSSSRPSRSTWSSSPAVDPFRDYSDVFGGGGVPEPQHKLSSPPPYDSIFQGSGDSNSKSEKNSSSSLPPVYDKPVYDDDIFGGVPGVKSGHRDVFDDVFASQPSKSSSGGGRHASSPPIEDLLETLGRPSKSPQQEKTRSAASAYAGVFDELISGFGGNSPPRKRETVETNHKQEPGPSVKSRLNFAEDPFVVLETPQSTHSSSGSFTDPLEHISAPMNSGSTKGNVRSVNVGIFDDINAFDSLAKSVPLSADSHKDDKRKETSPVRNAGNVSPGNNPDKKECPSDSTLDPFEHIKPKMQNGDDHLDPDTIFMEKPFELSNSNRSFNRASTQNSDLNTKHAETEDPSEMSQNSGSAAEIWLTVDEIPLFTQPTSAPQPSRPPPPVARRVPSAKIDNGASHGLDAKRNGTESFWQSSQTPNYEGQSNDSANTTFASTVDELESFASGRVQTYRNKNTSIFSGDEDFEPNSAAAASAMKEAVDQAEETFRQAKEVRVRERDANPTRSRESTRRESVNSPIHDVQDQEDNEMQERLERERIQQEKEERDKEREKEERRRERERERQAVERANREARERAAAEARLRAERAAVEKANAEARLRAERAAVQKATAEARERAAAEARERAAAEAREKAAAEAREKAGAERVQAEARRRAERAVVEKLAAEARERAQAEAREKAAAAAAATREKHHTNENDLESFFGMGSRANNAPHQRSTSSETVFDSQGQGRAASNGTRRTSTGASSTSRRPSSTTNIIDDLSSIFGGAPSSGEFQEVEGESEERRKARFDRHQRALDRAAKALQEKNERDMQTEREQQERHRMSESLDIEIKRWAAGKEGNLRALLSTLHYVLWPGCGWQPVSLTDLITAASVKKVYRKATLCVHPDKVQQKGATLQQKYISEKVFDLLKEAWNKFNSEELF